MSKALEKATEQYRAGQYKKAADTLWEVTFTGDDGDTEARGVLALAGQLRDVTQGGVRGECEEHIARAERLLNAGQRAASDGRVSEFEEELRQDPARLARWAREAGLTWLEIECAEDVVAAEMHAAMAAAAAGQSSTPPAGCLIDAVEAEGWRLEHVSSLFRPTKVQTSAFRGAEVFMGGEVVEGEEKYLYLFRREDGAAG